MSDLIQRIEQADGQRHKGVCNCPRCMAEFTYWLDQKRIRAAALRARENQHGR